MALDVGLLLSIAILLIFAKVFGEVTERLKFSPLVGEILAGILVGPILGLITPDPVLAQISGLGILFLMFLVGMSIKFDEVKDDIYAGSVIAAGCSLLSFVAGFFIGYFVFNDVIIGMVLGVAIVSTSSIISIRSMIDMGVFHSAAGKFLIITDMADDVISILTLSLLTSVLIGGPRLWETVGLFFAVIGFFLVILTFGAKIVGKFLSLFQTMKDEQILISVPIFIMFIVAFISENVGVAGVTGAFLAGIAMSKSKLTEPVIIPKVKTLGHGFFIPLFFAYSAIILDLSSLINSFWIVIVLLIAGAAAKFIGAEILSGYFGFRGRDKKFISIGLIPRGEYSIIIAQIAMAASVISNQVYGIIISFVILSIIITPILFALANKR